MPTKKKNYIRASDIGQYVYCRRAWWLKRVAGFEEEDVEGRLLKGSAAHTKHGRKVRFSRLQQRAAMVCLVLAALLAAIIILQFFL
jgi:CRISPR/Cas system-associated exonuclease Cas4 (RecB family)